MLDVSCMMAFVAARSITAEADRWRDVATRVHDRRVELDLTAAEVAEVAGLSLAVVSLIENARRESYAVRSLAALCRALRWSTDSIERIIDRGEPIEADPAEAKAEVEDRLESLEDTMKRFEARFARIEAALVVEADQAEEIATLKKIREREHLTPETIAHIDRVIERLQGRPANPAGAVGAEAG